jgi:hypothetical protein
VSDAKGDQTIDGFPVDVFGFYICTNRNPPGFYAVLYFDDSTYPSNPFRLYTRAAQDYGSTTQFYLYTTKGHLQMVNENSAAFTTTGHYTDSVKIDKYYSNVINTVNSTSTHENFHGNIDCETTAAGENGALDCLSKDDYVMVLSTNSGTHNAADLAANPVYPNIYQVKKISREDKTRTDRPKTNYGIWDSEQVRNQIVLDYSMNADFVWTGGIGETADTSAVVYKFYPPSISQRYDYAGECSNRGICNKATGLCDCFPGYSSDNCGMVNALSN